MKARAVDRRIQRTQQLLRDALMALIQEKGFESLSVQDIIDRANVGRATFYAHFDNKEDLLASGIENLRASLKERQGEALAAGIGGGLFGLLSWWGNGTMRMPVDEVDAAFRRLAIPSLKAAVRQATWNCALPRDVTESPVGNVRSASTRNTATSAGGRGDRFVTGLRLWVLRATMRNTIRRKKRCDLQ